jgi:murein DD-endopeptidase MepM/ murein hydrolase activator NlpD
MVVHDQPSPATPAASYAQSRLATAVVTERRDDTDARIAGRVVDYADVFENYEVRRGDHIDELARDFSTSRDVLLDANHIHRPYLIHPGEILKVPVSKAYVAEAGDTLSGVARRFGVEADELAQMNHISGRAALRAGQKIGLPSSMRDHGPLRSRVSEYATATARWTPSPAPSYYAHPALTPDRPAASFASAPVTATPPPAIGLSDAQIADAAKGRFVWPVRGDISAHFGPSGVGQRNDGVDIKAAQGTPVKAAAAGEVVYAGDQVPGFGNLVLVKHADGWVTAYAHLDTVDVQMKQAVDQGQALGTVGASGGLPQPALHFEVRYAPTPADKAKPVDPTLVLPAG